MRTILCAGLSLLGASCFYPADRGRALEARLDKLAEENSEMSKKMNARIDEKIAEVEKALENLDKASRRSGADIGVQLQKTIEDLAEVRGQVEMYLHKIGELENTMKQLTEQGGVRLADQGGPDTAKAADVRRRAEELKRPADKQGFLALADETAKKGDYPLARQLYVEFLKKWAKDSSAGEAHFGLGETYFAEERCREALFEYGKVIQDHAKTPSAPAAYLRSSDCFARLKMIDEAKLALEELIKQFPKSSEARSAKTKLAALEKTKPAPKKGKK